MRFGATILGIPVSLLALLALAACEPSVRGPAAMQAAPAPEPGETPAAVMDDAEAASIEQLTRDIGKETPAPEMACREDIGEAAAKKLADQCLSVSSATHPPCNAENTCEMIRDEIKRSCAPVVDDVAMKKACED